jgi:hypothetical protein
MISRGCIGSAPQEPRPPAFATAIESEGAEALAIGASKIGTRKPNRLQNASARSIELFNGSSFYDPDGAP